MEIKDIILIAGFLLTIITIIFSRKDRGEDKIERAINDIRESFNKDICLLFNKIDNLVSDKLCKERRENIVNDINGLGDLVRAKEKV